MRNVWLSRLFTWNCWPLIGWLTLISRRNCDKQPQLYCKWRKVQEIKPRVLYCNTRTQRTGHVCSWVGYGLWCQGELALAAIKPPKYVTVKWKNVPFVKRKKCIIARNIQLNFGRYFESCKDFCTPVDWAVKYLIKTILWIHSAQTLVLVLAGPETTTLSSA